MPPNATEPNREGLFRFRRHIAEANPVTTRNAQATATACRSVFAVLDPEETADITALNPDDICQRYQAAAHPNLSPAAIRSYQQRTQQAVADFRRFLPDPAIWQPSRQRRPRHKPAITAEPERQAATLYHFPLRQDVIVRFSGIPIDITEAEMTGITARLHSLAVPETDRPRPA